MHGILIVDKPCGPTSFDIVAKVRRAAKQKRVGHAGTLDPNASGVLVVCIGNATRIVEFLMDGRKGYRAEGIVGIETDSEDSTGLVVRKEDASFVTRKAIEDILPSFRGRILQTPPMVSALHHNGERLYDLARKGQVVEREARPIEIYSLELLDFKADECPTFSIEVECSKGTYIRTLCADIGKALGSVAHMSSLVRTHVGGFSLDDAVSLEEMERHAEEGAFESLLHPIDEALQSLPAVSISELDKSKVLNGVSVPYLEDQVTDATLVRVYGSCREFLAVGSIGRTDEGNMVVKPEKVFARVEDPSG